MNKVMINREPVELFKILKFEGLASTGGEANGDVETRKRKKMFAGDVITFAQQSYLLVLE